MKSILFENSKNFKKNKHIYFGDWCLDDPKKLDKNSFSKFKKKVVNEYHWNSDRKLEKDYKFLKKIQKKIFKILVKNLNEYHNTNYSEKYWKIEGHTYIREKNARILEGHPIFRAKNIKK